MSQMTRKAFLKQGLMGSFLAGLGLTAHSEKQGTPRETEGPFYPTYKQKDKDFDLTLIEGRKERAKGEVVEITGRVINTKGEPIEDATVDLWQANAAGRYRHPSDSSRAPLDPNFQGWAIVQSGKKGEFKFKTIIPGAYAVSNNWSRPPHIHFKITKRGYQELITQMYFPDQELNKKDRLLQRKSQSQQAMMIAKKISDKPLRLTWDIVLEQV